MMTRNKLPTFLRPTQSATPQRVAVGWYLEDEWTKVKAAAADAHEFEATYAQWLRAAEKALRSLHAAGIDAEKFYIKADDLLVWCLVHNKPNDGPSRAQFVSQGELQWRSPC